MTDARHRPLRRTRRGSVAAVLALSAALATAPALAAGPQPLEEIAAAAVSAVGAEDAQAAEAVLAPSLRLARCRQPLQAVATGPRTAQVRCADDPGWHLYVPVRVRREAEVVVLRSPAPAGRPITADQLVVQTRDIGAAAGPAFRDPQALVGRVPLRALAPGAVPTEQDLSLGAPLRRGDPVVLVSRVGGVEVRVPGRAMGPAQAGGRIGVQNVSSGRVLRGRLVGEGVVELLP
ncbi:flagellar basal body P-ring formation chaperone FlgA [Luteimonas wenzhouensis]|jgi:flagella basal body P-ring formation protein FlgA|uniref:Flagella basal body P-ring formation protein FlgA n=1 Tax=Luteimonas wenzhouensis TaxID=2599615 RepID=A0A5C5TZM7_9GAMM|nr:flagellar basal body P-ring formation chaperone FlgA [Luteimonas wenzhouensis]NLW96270.1 flagellar basal body P-ring formation protein FlgA [Xanthomonadaceae bacterium]TWT18732.1 flagellar basal body P-ring formation protein FlgA [Luteimonas wenzhouensis]